MPSSIHELGLEPFYSSGDGNCFYNSLSILMCGHEYDSEIYRLRAALYDLGHYEHIVEAVRIDMYLTDVDICCASARLCWFVGVYLPVHPNWFQKALQASDI